MGKTQSKATSSDSGFIFVSEYQFAYTYGVHVDKNECRNEDPGSWGVRH
jgi:hypothetical protein